MRKMATKVAGLVVVGGLGCEGRRKKKKSQLFETTNLKKEEEVEEVEEVEEEKIKVKKDSLTMEYQT